jgi:hypothetical protein
VETMSSLEKVFVAVSLSALGLILIVNKVWLGFVCLIFSATFLLSASSSGTTRRESRSESYIPRKVKKQVRTPRKVLVMLNNDLNLALRLYEGVASRNQGKNSEWIWGKVASDLERDRR